MTDSATEFQPIRTAAVIGAGSMGSGIAAHLANAGVRVHLLDIPADGEDRDARAKAGIERQLGSHGFFDPSFAERIVPGNIEDHADRLAEAEWVVEAVFEDLKVKHQTFATIDAHRAPGTPVSSNTSTIPLAQLTEGLDDSLARDFAIIHFFNPPRVMRLVELVAGERTAPEVAERLTEICERQLGKVVVTCRDTPGFIANRVGNLWMAAGASLALERGIAPELADAAFSKPFGVPRTGIFGLFDYVGLQLVPAIWGSLLGAVPADDAYHRFDITQREEFQTLLDKKLFGRSTKAGFYRGREEVFDFGAGDYRPKDKPTAQTDPALGEKKAKGVIATDSPAGRFARDTFLTTLAYCCDVAAEIADTVAHIDTAMELGYGWKKGPFALADEIGLEDLAQAYRETEGFGTVPELLQTAIEAGGFYPVAGKALATTGEAVDLPRRSGVVTVAGLGAEGTSILSTDVAEAFLLGGEHEGIAILTLKTPMNSCPPEVLDSLEEIARTGADKGVKALVVATDNERAFSAGADLNVLSGLAAKGDKEGLAKVMRHGARALGALKEAPFPVIGAVRGTALGGGCEFVLHLDALAIHSETILGFPEEQVGLFPAWGGTARTLERLIDVGVENPYPAAFELIMSATKFRGAYPAKRAGFVRDSDRIVVSADHVLAEALDLAAELAASGYQPERDRELPVYHADAPKLEWTKGSETDAAIGAALARVYTAPGVDAPKTVRASELIAREAEEAAGVLVQPANAERAVHMAKTRRPLKN